MGAVDPAGVAVGADLDPVAAGVAGDFDAGSFGQGGDDAGLGGRGGAHVDAAGGVGGGAVLGMLGGLGGLGVLGGFGVLDGLGGGHLAAQVGAVDPAGVAVGADLDPVPVSLAGDLDAGAVSQLVNDLPGRRRSRAHVNAAGGAGGSVVEGRTALVTAGRGAARGVNRRLGGGRSHLAGGEVATVDPTRLAIDGDREPAAVRTTGDLNLLTTLGNGEDLAGIGGIVTNVDRDGRDHGVGERVGPKMYRADALLSEEALVNPAGGSVHGDGDPPAHLLAGNLHRLATGHDGEDLAGVGGCRAHVDVRCRVHRLRVSCVCDRTDDGGCNNADTGGEGDGGGSTSD